MSRIRILLTCVLLCSATAGIPVLAQAQPGEVRREHEEGEKMSLAEFASKLRFAQAYEETRDMTNAVRLYEELYRANPKDEVVFDGLTRGLFYLKRYDDAERIVKKELETNRTMENMLLFARLEAQLNKRSDALAAFKAAEDAVPIKECIQYFPIISAMMDVSYNQDALELLDKMRSLGGGEDMDICTSQIAGLYLRLGEFGRGSRELLALIKENAGNVGMVEQRLAQYMTDSVSRSEVLGALEGEIQKSEQTPATLRLLAWLYGEQKNYAKALETIVKLDVSTDPGRRSSEGMELLQFADRARMEGALDVAVRAYDEAIKRMKQGDNNRQAMFIAQAELGSLNTNEAYLLSKPHTKEEISALVTKYEEFAARQPLSEFLLMALNRAGDLSMKELFDLDRATRNFEAALNKSRGLSERARDAGFGLVDVALARQDFQLVNTRLDAIEQLLLKTRTPNDKEVLNRIAYQRALSLYYQAAFDSAQVILERVAADASCDFANDAIQLSALIEENNSPTGLTALKMYSAAALAEYSRKYEEAQRQYKSIVETQPFAAVADDAALHSAEMLVKLAKPDAAVQELETMQEKMITSPMLDRAAFRMAEIVERELHDKARAQRLYEDFLARYPTSSYAQMARDRARRLRGDMF